MQIKKEEVRMALLNAAEQEFLSKGFNNASLRKIIKAAGTTIGNFYNYFDSKEAIYEALVEEEYNKFVYFIEHHDEINRPDYLWDVTDIRKWRSVLFELIEEYIPHFSNRFVLLIEGSEGTRYEKTREMLLNILREHFVSHMEEFGRSNVHPEMAEIIAIQFIEGFLFILKNYTEETMRKKLITEHLLFHFMGSMSLIGDFK